MKIIRKLKEFCKRKWWQASTILKLLEEKNQRRLSTLAFKKLLVAQARSQDVSLSTRLSVWPSIGVFSLIFYYH